MLVDATSYGWFSADMSWHGVNKHKQTVSRPITNIGSCIKIKYTERTQGCLRACGVTKESVGIRPLHFYEAPIEIYYNCLGLVWNWEVVSDLERYVFWGRGTFFIHLPLSWPCRNISYKLPINHTGTILNCQVAGKHEMITSSGLFMLLHLFE